MSDQPKPAFYIREPNRLDGSNVHVVLNAEMCRSLCDHFARLADNNELTEDENHFYAFYKRMRAHFYEKSRMYQEIEQKEENLDEALALS